MSEWLKEHAWKACVGETLPWVRIPPSPPTESLQGEVPEWPNGAVSKTVDRATGPWVRIPPSPPRDRVAAGRLFDAAVVDAVIYCFDWSGGRLYRAGSKPGIDHEADIPA